MLDKFIQYIKKESLFTQKHKLLVALSGGNDSMALCKLLKEAGFNFAVAHCNFKLRGSESDADATFVENYCTQNKIKHFYTSFETNSYAAKNKLSTQMAARDLRYKWFDELIKKNKFNYLLTAHHLNDNIETFFINLLRGSGINGLKGIVPKNENKVRPLLFATRDEIEEYVKQNAIQFREDSSNIEDKYLRNRLRHYIIPEFKRLNPSFEQTMAKELEILQEVNGLVINEVEKKKKAIASIRNGNGKIDIAKLEKTDSPRLLLFEILKEFGFNPTQVANIYDALQGLPGKVFISETHTLIKDRKYLIIKKKSARAKEEISIYKNSEEIKESVNLTISYVKLKKGGDTKIPTLKNFAYLDADKLKFPLTLAKWKLGDKFRPLGMKDFKKLSDFFIAEKMNLFEKENQWVLHSGKEIVWVLDRRIDDRFKITDKTKRICVIELNT